MRGIEDKTMSRPYLNQKWIAKPNAIPVIIVVDSKFKSIKMGLELKKVLAFEMVL